VNRTVVAFSAVNLLGNGGPKNPPGAPGNVSTTNCVPAAVPSVLNTFDPTAGVVS
jgi:hypothetical protein